MTLAQHHSKGVEHYTPSLYVDPARELFGGRIDLDPASCALANTVVQADTFYELPQDGLLEPWRGNVWLNPPYGWRDHPNGTSNKELWSRRAVLAYESSEAEACVMCLTASTGDPWFKQLWGYSICFPDKRISFWGPKKGANNPGSNAIIYLGDEHESFRELYEPLGRIVSPDERYRDPDNQEKYETLLLKCGAMQHKERKQLSIFA